MRKRTGSSLRIDLRKLARVGAESRLKELEGERLALLRAFPNLSHASRNASVKGTPTRRRRRRMTAAQKKAVSRRMKRYWAAKRKEAGK